MNRTNPSSSPTAVIIFPSPSNVSFESGNKREGRKRRRKEKKKKEKYEAEKGRRSQEEKGEKRETHDLLWLHRMGLGDVLH
jgi:hypothetical protein